MWNAAGCSVPRLGRIQKCEGAREGRNEGAGGFNAGRGEGRSGPWGGCSDSVSALTVSEDI